MANFTTISGGTRVSKITIANEIITAYNEHRAVSNDAPVSAFAAGDPISDHTWIDNLQLWIENNCTDYVNHTVAVAGAASVTMWTWTALKTAASLNASGFTRRLNVGADQFGNMEIGDRWSPTIEYQELQATLDLLRWTTEGGIVNDQDTKSVVTGDTTTCATARTDSSTNWPAGWTNPGGGTSPYTVNKSWDLTATIYSFDAARAQGGGSVSGIINSGLAWDWSCFYLPTAPAGGTFNDLDGLGIAEDEFELIEDGGTEAAATTTAATSVKAGDGSANWPYDHGSVSTCPFSGVNEEGVFSTGTTWLIKWVWSFTA